MKTFIRYFKLWLSMTKKSSQITLESRAGALIFILGKLLRFAFFLLFIVLLESKTKTIAGYSLWQIILFFATFNLIDVIPQFFLREVYGFRQLVVSGEFDYVLLKPVSALFRSLFGGSDVLDISLLVVSVFLTIFAASKLETFTLSGVLIYVILVVNALLIALSFHIFILGVGILTTAIDNTLWMYRDLTQMGRLPIDVYREPIRGLITFVIPVGIMTSFPPKALLGLLSAQFMLISVCIAVAFFIGSLKFWQFALKRYTSASS